MNTGPYARKSKLGKGSLKEEKVEISAGIFDKYKSTKTSALFSNAYKSNKKDDTESEESAFSGPNSGALASLYNSNSGLNSNKPRASTASSRRVVTTNATNFFPSSTSSGSLPSYNYPNGVVNMSRSANAPHSQSFTAEPSNSNLLFTAPSYSTMKDKDKDNGIAQGSMSLPHSISRPRASSWTDSTSENKQIFEKHAPTSTATSADKDKGMSTHPYIAGVSTSVTSATAIHATPASVVFSQRERNLHSAPITRKKSVRFAEELVTYYSSNSSHSANSFCAPVPVVLSGGNFSSTASLEANPNLNSNTTAPAIMEGVDSAGNALNNASNIASVPKPVALTGILVNGLLKNNSEGNKTSYNVINNVNNTNKIKSNSNSNGPPENGSNPLPSANLTKQESGMMMMKTNSNRWMNPNPTLSNLEPTTSTTTTTDISNGVMVGSSSSLIRQIGRLKLNNSTVPQPNRGFIINSTGADSSSGGGGGSNSGTSNAANANKVSQEVLLIEDLKSNSGESNSSSTQEQQGLYKDIELPASMAVRSPSLLYRMPTKSFSIGMSNTVGQTSGGAPILSCRQPAISASTVAFFGDRLEYAFYTQLNSAQKDKETAVINMDIDFVQMKNVSVQGAKFRFQVPRHILLSNASAAALAYVNNTNSSSNNTTNGSIGSSSSSTILYEPCMCVLEFTSMINIAIVREKIVPLIQSRQQLMIQSVS